MYVLRFVYHLFASIFCYPYVFWLLYIPRYVFILSVYVTCIALLQKNPQKNCVLVIIIFFFLFFSGNTDLLCQNQVNIVVKPKLLWNFRFPRHLHPQFLQQQIRILHNLIKKFPSIHHNRKINKPIPTKIGPFMSNDIAAENAGDAPCWGIFPCKM